MNKRSKQIENASWVSMIGNAFLAILKISFGFITNSLAVLADGIDSAGDVIISIITLITARYISKPPNEKFPYGYGKAEPIATKALSFVIFFAGIQLAYTSIQKLLTAGEHVLPSKFSIIVILVSIAGKFLLSLYQLRTGKKTKSPMLIANGKNMQGDILISLSVLIGLILTHVFNKGIFDTILALLVSIWIIRIAVKIFLKTFAELMDAKTDPEMYNRLFEALECVPGVKNPHRVLIRKIGYNVMISVDLEIDGNLPLKEAHRLSHIAEDCIKQKFDNVFDIHIHIEPIGDKTAEKKVGVSLKK
jgi:cation diffusion facilitator family transporter